MKFSYTEINECAVELNQSLSKITNLVADIKASCQTLQKSVWEGEAADYYCNKLNGVLQGYLGIEAQLSECISSINRSLENYKNVDNLIVKSTDSAISGLKRVTNSNSVSAHV